MRISLTDPRLSPTETRLSRWDVLAASLLRSRPSLARSGARYPHPGEAF